MCVDWSEAAKSPSPLISEELEQLANAAPEYAEQPRSCPVMPQDFTGIDAEDKSNDAAQPPATELDA